MVDLGLGATPVDAGTDAPPAEHARARVDAQLRAMVEHTDGTREGVDPEELHKFRVAIRRLRSLLRNADLFGEKGTRLRAELKWLAALTGPVRDLDVLLERLPDEVAAVAGSGPSAAQPDDASVEAITTALRNRRRRKHNALSRAMGTKRYRALLDGLAQLATQPRSDIDGHQASQAISLRKPRRKAHKAAKRARSDAASDHDLHALRIKVKRLRYAAETALPAANGDEDRQLKSVVQQAKKLQDILGDHQDAVVAAQVFSELAGRDGRADVAFLAGRLVERQNQRRADARAAWRQAWKNLNEAAKPLA